MIKKILMLIIFSSTLSFGNSNWLQVSSATYGVHSDVFFLNETLGWIVGYEGTILNTTDGGITWTKSIIPIHEFGNLYSVFFINENIGYVGGSDEILFKTEDGGSTWQEVPFESIGGKIKSIYFADENRGWILSRISGGG